MAWWDKNSTSDNKFDDADYQTRFDALTSQLSELDGIDRGPRDYSLAEETNDYVPPEPPPLQAPRGWKLVALMSWTLTIAIPLLMWFFSAYFSTVGGFLYGIVVTIACVSLFASLRGFSSGYDDTFNDDNGARV
ncbi:MAG: hypothetical protein Q4P66_09365 [Actinomycetaceae bacterium]|nr:hypothetical protein [Actinomycetaceae bacterium]